MTLIFADLPDDDVKRLDQFAAEQGKSRVAMLSMIIRWYRQQIEKNR